jgi:hypothetical protein
MGVTTLSVACIVLFATFALSIKNFGARQRAAARFVTPQQAAARRRSGGWAFLIFGGIGFLVNGALFVFADADLTAYRNAASCRAGLELAAPLDATCSIGTASIENAYRTSGKGAATHVVLAFADGHTENVIQRRILDGSVLAGFRDAGDRDATIQRFRGRTVLVASHSGAFETANMPLLRVNELGIFAIVFGVVGVIGALILAFRS